MQEMKEKAKDVADLLKILSNENRLLILCELISGAKSVNSMLESLQISQSGISQHLAILKANGLVDYEKKAQTVYYSIKDQKVVALMSSIKELYC